MPSKKLMSLLGGFSRYELNRFRKYLYSPYFNENKEIILLFNYIDSHFRNKEHNGQTEWVPEKGKVWKELFASRPFNDGHLRRLCSELNKYAYDYLALSAYRSSPIRSHRDLLEVLLDRKLEKHFQGVVRQAQQILDKSPLRDAGAHMDHYQIERSVYLDIEQSGRKLPTFENLEKADFHLDCYYYTQKLRNYCYALNYRNTLSVQPELNVRPETLDYLLDEGFLAELSVHAYYLVARMLQEPEKESYFHDLKTLLRKEATSLTHAELNHLYIFLMNYCIDTKINNGRSEYFQELFEIFRTILEQGIIIKNGILEAQDYKNIITVGLHVKEFDWVEQFIQNYTGALPQDNQENALTYNLAKVYFHREQYEKVIEQLREVEYQNQVYALGSKLMLLKTYYELREYLALDSLIDSFRIYLRRNSRISREVKQQYMNILRFVKKLSNIKGHDQAVVEKIKAQVEECKALASKKWILEKIEELT